MLRLQWNVTNLRKILARPPRSYPRPAMLRPFGYSDPAMKYSIVTVTANVTAIPIARSVALSRHMAQ